MLALGGCLALVVGRPLSQALASPLIWSQDRLGISIELATGMVLRHTLPIHPIAAELRSQVPKTQLLLTLQMLCGQVCHNLLSGKYDR